MIKGTPEGVRLRGAHLSSVRCGIFCWNISSNIAVSSLLLNHERNGRGNLCTRARKVQGGSARRPPQDSREGEARTADGGEECSCAKCASEDRAEAGENGSEGGVLEPDPHGQLEHSDALRDRPIYPKAAKGAGDGVSTS